MIILYILLGILAVFLLYVCFLAICSLCVDPKKEYAQNSRFYRTLLYGATAIALKVLRIKVHTNGLEKLPQDQKLLFVGNHRSNFDPIIQWQILKHWDVAFISKKENFKIPIFGRFIRKCCFMAIDRENPRNALGTIQKASGLLRDKEVSIGVYPEGTRSKTGELLPFHDGVFYIAKKADAPIAVMSVKGTEQIHKNVLRRRSDVYLDILQIISAQDVKTRSTHVLGNEIRQALIKNLDLTDTSTINEKESGNHERS